LTSANSIHGQRVVVTRADLRRFGLTVGGALVVLFGLTLPWLFSFAIPYWPFVLGGALIIAGLVAPAALGPVQTVWMWVAEKVGAFNSRVILTLVFYAVFTPFGWLRRVFGVDAMGARDAGAATYRKPSQQRNSKSLEKPF
jgi:saxitoxin biosynthesis operon SxtJ-like protein